MLLFTRHAAGEPRPREAGMPLVCSDLVHLGPLEALSSRELEVLCLIGEELATKEIAQVLQLWPRTGAGSLP